MSRYDKFHMEDVLRDHIGEETYLFYNSGGSDTGIIVEVGRGYILLSAPDSGNKFYDAYKTIVVNLENVTNIFIDRKNLK